MQFFGGHPRSLAAALEHGDDQRHSAEFLPDDAHLLLVVGTFDVEPVHSGLQVHFGALQRVAQSIGLEGIGSRDQEKTLFVGARGDRCLQLPDHIFRRDDFLPRHVTATLGRLLVFHEERRRSHLFIDMDRVGHVLLVAVSVIGVDQHGQVAGAHDLAHRLALLAQAREVHIGITEARAIEGESADLIRGKSSVADQLRRERVRRRRQLQRSMFA